MVRRISISLRMTMWFGCIFFAGWLAFGSAMWFSLKHTLTNERYQTLSRRINRLEDLLNRNSKESHADKAQDFSDFANATGNGLSEVFYANGTRAFPSPSLSARSFPWPSISSSTSEQFLHLRSSGQGYWVLVRPFTAQGQSLFVLAAAPSAGSELLLQRFLSGLLASVPIVLLIASCGGYFISRKALQPVGQIITAAHSISIRNLSERLPISNTGDELQRLAETCNEMFGRLEGSVNQIKQFTADASHELRGPLSFTRTVAEVALRNPGVDRDSQQAFSDIVEEVAKASVVLNDLLTLARADAERFDMVVAPVNLSELVQESYERALPIARERQHILSISVRSEAQHQILGDFDSLRRLIWIFLDNAMKYTLAGGTIKIGLEDVNGCSAITIADNGLGIPEEDIPYIFDRFFRADPSRSLVDGSGLGLAIAKWIADMHRATLNISSTINVGTTVRVAFPEVSDLRISGI